LRPARWGRLRSPPWSGTQCARRRRCASLPPEELNRIGFRLYERFRPEVPAGAAGWGKKGVLDLKLIENAQP